MFGRERGDSLCSVATDKIVKYAVGGPGFEVCCNKMASLYCPLC